ncbi:MAG TPA: HAMP domain-containing sensor histidine kinase [Caldithrix abyssi]|uniref:histidine kinase n=1 Tax=Caldithrix abyssi TaxID=187145 RepID=A0A7V4U1C6_CALAY|nr:HAMP domain-containing sensor histidine kinase [Caldithrix abyssi]
MKFRTKVLASLTVLLITVSFISFWLFSNFLLDRMKANYEEHMTTIFSLLRENYLYMLGNNSGKYLNKMLDELNNNHDVIRAVLLDSDGRIVYLPDKTEAVVDSFIPLDWINKEKLTNIQSYNEGDRKIRAIMTVENRPECYDCHEAQKKILGYINIDFRTEHLAGNMDTLKTFGWIMTAIILLSVLISMRILHYRSIRNSLNKFQDTITDIQKGNLEVRVPIDSSDELGRLAKSFNLMLEKLKLMQEELEEYHKRELMQAQKLATVGEMASGIAHEIKNPLTGIANAIEIIAEEMDDSSKKPILDEIHRQVQRVNKTINDLLRFSRPIDLQLAAGNINEVIRTMVFFLQNQVKTSDIQFITRLRPDIPVFDFDAKQIEAVLINLGLNAIQAIESKGFIEVFSRFLAEEDTVEIVIKDSGCGIPVKNLSKVVKPFFTTKSKGTGLGLSISKEIIEKHGGKIHIESEEKRGTIVTISLPVKKKVISKNFIFTGNAHV